AQVLVARCDQPRWRCAFLRCAFLHALLWRLERGKYSASPARLPPSDAAALDGVECNFAPLTALRGRTSRRTATAVVAKQMTRYHVMNRPIRTRPQSGRHGMRTLFDVA